eukprot:Nk52_evm4s276 gene=Nk52_evmTU4s276
MFISVKYGEDELEIFNANCISIVLLAAIKEACGQETLMGQGQGQGDLANFANNTSTATNSNGLGVAAGAGGASAAYNNVTVDLCDETGLVKNLSNHLDDYASSYLAKGGVYILVRVDKAEDSSECTYTPLLNTIYETNPKFTTRLPARGRAEKDLSVSNDSKTQKSRLKGHSSSRTNVRSHHR